MTAIPIFISKNLKRNVYGIEIDGKVHLDKVDSRPRIVQYLINYIYPSTYHLHYNVRGIFIVPLDDRI